MSNPKVSVIIPVYNVEKYLVQCLDSIINQSYKELEIILIDDGSSDGSGIICDQYASLDPRIQVVHKANEGVSAARNTALDMMTGSLVTFVDSDDWLDLDIISQCVEFLSRHPQVNILQFGVTEYRDGALSQIAHEYSSDDIDDIMRDYALKKHIQPIPCAKIYRVEIFKGLRFPLGKFHEDVVTIFDALCLCSSFVSIPISGYVYRKERPGSTTSSFSEKRLDLFDNIQASIEKPALQRSKHYLECLNTIRVMYLRFYCIEAWMHLPEQGRKAWLQQLSLPIRNARRSPYIYGTLSERIHWGLFLLSPKIYLDLWCWYIRRKG